MTGASKRRFTIEEKSRAKVHSSASRLITEESCLASLYLHIPFCEHKCIYCDFYSITPNDRPAEGRAFVKRFLAALDREIDLRASEEHFAQRIETIFFGGGTPSLLQPKEIASVLEKLRRCFHIDPKAEITLETNPGTVESAKLGDFRSVGINRLSIGIQSFHDDDLRFLSRIHTAEEAKACVNNAFAVGFENVSLDLIFALPSQSADRWKANLQQAVALNPTHLSCYSLIVEHNTPLARMVQAKQVMPLSVEEDAALYELTMEFLSSRGFEQYEVSNFAKPGFKSRHNSNYWNHVDYLGFGPSAHSFWREREAPFSARRWWNIANVIGYAERLERDRLPQAGEERLTREQLREEEIFLGLRSEGLDVAGFRKKYRRDILQEYGTYVAELIRQNFAILEGDRLRLTSKGYLLCDEICLAFR